VATLTGTVTDRDGKAVVGAAITVRLRAGDPPAGRGVCDSAGRYTIGDLERRRTSC
jgi:hypothetical protein